ncbi:MAG: flippase-like domain-containing protein [Bacteroidia bacterium]|nr:flippase-like domain-containing protein [Bacteroidia bacterium]
MSIGFLLLAWAFNNINLDKLILDVKNTNLFWLSIAMICGLFSHFIRAIRWNLLLSPIGYKAATSNSFYAVIIGYFSNYLVPRLGEITRCATLSKTDNIPVEKLLGTVFIERVVDLIITAIITLLIFMFQFDLLTDFINKSILPLTKTSNNSGLDIKIILIAIAVCCALIFILFRKKIQNLTVYKKFRNLAVGFAEGIKSIIKMKNPILFISYSLLIWLMYFSTAYFTFFTYSPTSNLGINAGMMVLFLGTISIILPIPGGIGVFHKLVGAGLVLYGVNENEGITYATISHAIQMIMIFIAGLLSMLIVGIKFNKKTE